jgi:predicted DNA-binding antitoxin AbrB/MazE fold protein
MAIEIEAIYENGVLKPAQPLPLQEQERVRISIRPCGIRSTKSYGLVQWTGSVQDLDYLIQDDENDPLERP